MKVKINNLTDLFTVIEKMVNATNIPQKQKGKYARRLKEFAQEGYNLGKNGSVEVEV